ncbi:MAG: DNA-binding protein Alba [Candidatus Bathyarchaeia archaeon]|nr:DNA-binding protein Alba [Candidatus Bathyarchaeota archaeon]
MAGLQPNVVLVGKKPVMTYVLSVVSLISSGSNEVILKARGRAITTAVDVAQVTKRRFLDSLRIESVTIGTEDVQTKEGGKRSVSSIEITLRAEGKSKAETTKSETSTSKG